MVQILIPENFNLGLLAVEFFFSVTSISKISTLTKKIIKYLELMIYPGLAYITVWLSMIRAVIDSRIWYCNHISWYIFRRSPTLSFLEPFGLERK